MENSLTNYDGSITSTPRALVHPETVEEIQAVLRDHARYPSPVRAMGSNHSLTPCASTAGTVVDMSRMTKVIEIDEVNHTITAQAGLQLVDASRALRERGLQLMTNAEIGNMRLGAASCCHSKDALDGIEFGQVSSYVTRIKWVTPSGELAEASVADSPDLLRMVRSSSGLVGVIYEVTFRVKPLEVLHFTYLPRPVKDLTQEEIDALLKAEGMICWTIGRTSVFQRRQRVTDPGILESLEAAGRRWLWNYGDAHIAHIIDQFVSNKGLRDAAEQGFMDAEKLLFETLRLFGGITLYAPDKIIDYSKTQPANRYAFTFWAFPCDLWLKTLREYLDFADDHFAKTGFRCNMPLGAYHIRKDQSSILSYTHDGDMFSIDPIHSPTDVPAWHNFLQRFNEFATQRGGVPLLNQSPFVERRHLEAAYGQRWLDFSAWVRTLDPGGRMLNPFFADLLSPA
jgi:FAD/FMN-containing dehydrogenase